MIKYFRSLILLVIGVISISQISAQNLPTGITTTAFYDVTNKDLSFKIAKQSVSGIYEVPGKPEHFFVLGYLGFVWSLYPDTNKTYQPGAIKDYKKKEIANFNKMTRKGHEQGALGAAFDPNFKKNRFFYVLYNRYQSEAQYREDTRADQAKGDGAGNEGKYALERWKVTNDYGSLVRDTTILVVDKGKGYGACTMVFGKDGYLYISMSSYSRNGWDLTDLMRKVIRIDVSKTDGNKMYAIPETNPFFNSTDPQIKKEIFAYGFRNTYGITANLLTGSILGAEVGESEWEEVNIIESGKNYGWANGGDAQPMRMGVGIEGPCSNNTTSGTAFTHNWGPSTPADPTNKFGVYQENFKYTGPESQNKKVTCADFTNARWSFEHHGKPPATIKTALPDLNMACIVLSPVFRGDPKSPYYGYHFVSDVKEGYFIAIKEGVEAAQNVGKFTSYAIPGTHDGLTSFGEDSYGNLYVTLLSSTLSGPQNWHDIYKLKGDALTPLKVPRDSEIVGISNYRNQSKGFSQWKGVLFNGKAGTWISVPANSKQVKVYTLAGKLRWTGSVENASSNKLESSQKRILVPLTLGEGSFQFQWN